jgi:hypothetical protein
MITLTKVIIYSELVFSYNTALESRNKIKMFIYQKLVVVGK